MTKLNKQFIEAMQKRLDERDRIFTGDKNYKNMGILILRELMFNDAYEIRFKEQNYTYDREKELLVDISNRCQMLWEILGERK